MHDDAEQRLLGVCEDTVQQALKSGADAAEAFATRITEHSILLRKNEPGPFTVGAREGSGLRVAVGKKIGFYSVSSTDAYSIKLLCRMALSSARVSPADNDWRGFAEGEGTTHVDGVFDKTIAEMGPETLIHTANEMYDTIDGFDGHVSLVEGGIGVGVQLCSVANSNGIAKFRAETEAGVGVYMQAEEAGAKGTASESRSERHWTAIKQDELIMKAGNRALDMIKATTIPISKLDVIFENRAATGFISNMILPLVLADSVQRGRSPWAGKLGQKVLPAPFTIIDRGDLPTGLGSKVFDDEGVATQRTTVLERGKLLNFLYDSYTAKKEQKSSTGNASRRAGSIAGSSKLYNMPPRPGPTNFILKEGDFRLEDLFESSKAGLYIVDVIGDWLSNSAAQVYTATVTEGYLVSQGEARKPVKGLTISCDVKRLADEDVQIAKDLDHIGGIYSPSMKISNFNVSS